MLDVITYLDRIKYKHYEIEITMGNFIHTILQVMDIDIIHTNS